MLLTAGRISCQTMEGHVQVGGHSGVIDAAGAHAAYGVAGEVQHLLRGEHGGLGVELGLELGVVNLGVPGADDEHAAPVHRKGEGLGDAGGFAPPPEPPAPTVALDTLNS